MDKPIKIHIPSVDEVASELARTEVIAPAPHADPDFRNFEEWRECNPTETMVKAGIEAFRTAITRAWPSPTKLADGQPLMVPFNVGNDQHLAIALAMTYSAMQRHRPQTVERDEEQPTNRVKEILEPL